MSSRETILEAVLKNQPPATTLPELAMFNGLEDDLITKYVNLFTAIGGNAIVVEDMKAVGDWILGSFDTAKRIVTTLAELNDMAELLSITADPHSFDDVELSIIRGHFCVAENGAVWLTEELMGQRIIPYICQHLAVVIQAEDILPTLHEAYERIQELEYGFGGFIGGPSKTADIEQALVLGAHGPLTMTVFIIRREACSGMYTQIPAR